MKKFFLQWYSQQVVDHIQSTEDQAGEKDGHFQKFKPDLKLSTLKPIHANWLIKVLGKMSTNHDLLKKGWTMVMEMQQESAGTKEFQHPRPSQQEGVRVSVPVENSESGCDAPGTVLAATPAPVVMQLPFSPSASHLPVLLLYMMPLFRFLVFLTLNLNILCGRSPKSKNGSCPPRYPSPQLMEGQPATHACTIISAEMVRAVLQNPDIVPPACDFPPESIAETFVAAIRSGNKCYDISNCVGLLRLDKLLALFPDLSVAVSLKRDLGFFNCSHIERNLPMLNAKSSVVCCFIYPNAFYDGCLLCSREACIF